MGHLDDLAFDPRLTTHARRLGIESPLDVSLVEWKGRSYYHVSGLDREGRRVLIEVFTINSHGTLQAVLAFEYPPPIRNLYPN
ncbi:hypothetical protein [Cupriavidus sp. UYPR2.512]|uniref:hypothetical protein n=1 Tax=Cupriavidus sp. UYPR2.512 TaxID=1080187 RepID=UPI0003744FE9|nr:hypothetical protein [Cupriavidus sp. UYPR2.512]UIF88189.1 hypothetical protein KAF44_20290 [Cupriavidus necator]